MSWFKKRDVIDLTRLQKQGVLERSKQIEEGKQNPNSSSGVLDLSPSQPSTGDSNPLAGFFGNVDSSSSFSTESENKNETSYGSYTDRLRAARNSKTDEINSLKIKLEDTEYKLEKVLEKLGIIESRLEEFERRIA